MRVKEMLELKKSNFEFIKIIDDLSELYKDIEDSEIYYAKSEYKYCIESIFEVTNKILIKIIDSNFWQLPFNGNLNEHLSKIKENLNRDNKNIVDILEHLDKIKFYRNTIIQPANQDEIALELFQRLRVVLNWYIKNYTDEKIKFSEFIVPQVINKFEGTNERKIIYVQTVDDKNSDWPLYEGARKIGETSSPSDEMEVNWKRNSEDLQRIANSRVSNYMTTSGVPYKIEWAELAWNKDKQKWFSDKDVHDVLNRSGYKLKQGLKGTEWYEIPLNTAINAISVVKNPSKSLKSNFSTNNTKIRLREEQNNAVDMAMKAFKTYSKVLWNAKMRFGKTLASYDLISKMDYKKILVITHRPVVSDSWYEDFNKYRMDEKGYKYLSDDFGQREILESDEKYIRFLSIQHLRGSDIVGGKHSKHHDIFDTEWDLVVVDEAHEGTQTPLGQIIYEKLLRENTKLLELSGTPFNLTDGYNEEQIFTWDYVMEQSAKVRFAAENPYENNPYEILPEVQMFTYKINSNKKFENVDGYFDFWEFFKVNDDKVFVYENEVKQWLNLITNQKNSNYPFSTEKYRETIRHTLWLLPRKNAADALEKLLKKNKTFSQYTIVNLATDDDESNATSSDLERVRKAISNRPSKTKTIILTVRKLTTGVNIPELNGVVFLNNTNSAQNYLQAAFRAQTPFSDAELGMKKKAYIFDFAPDRALNMIGLSITNQRGNRFKNETEDKENLKTLLNFLPILGEFNNEMKPYNVNSMLRQIKKAYAEKAVLSGFEDSSIYNDELWKITKEDTELFENIRQKIGKTYKKTPTKKIPINEQGLSDKERQKARKLKKKSKKERTREEIELLEKERKKRNEVKKIIHILRGVSIRIPLMIYGMEAELKDDITIDEFVNNVDYESWNEFMPEGITKKDFVSLSRFYDESVFIEAGHRIRRTAINANRLSVQQRINVLTDLFSNFKNPDKETVLTPWRVVNLHLGKTLGGNNFFDESFSTEINDGNFREIFYETISNNIFNNEVRVLDINSKTGLYLLYVAFTIYQKRFSIEHYNWSKSEFVQKDKDLWIEVLKNNIFSLNRTPMSKTITFRTLLGYEENDDVEKNFVYSKKITENIKDDMEELSNDLLTEFGVEKLKFDVVIGNPPYQESTKQGEINHGQQRRVKNIFHEYQKLAENLSSKYTSLIYPGRRWIQKSGKGMKDFGLYQMNDPKLLSLIYFEDANEIFTDVEIFDGISIVLKDMEKNTNTFDYSYIKEDESVNMLYTHPGDKVLPMNPVDIPIANKIYDFMEQNNLPALKDSEYIVQKLFRIESNFVEQNEDKVVPFNSQKFNENEKIKILTNDKAGKAGRAKWYLVDRSEIEFNSHLINKWKVVVSSANAGGQKRDNQIEIIDNKSVFGRSRIALNMFDTKLEAENFYKYSNSSIIRYAFTLTDESLSSLALIVPNIINYNTQNDFIDFNFDVDIQLKNLLKLSEEEYQYILKIMK